MERLHHVLIALRGRLSARRGAAALEFGLIAPILITVLIGVVDIGGSIQQRIRLEAAARSALGYAHVYSENIADIRNIVIGALSGWNNATVDAVVVACDCATTSGGVTTVVAGTCTVACASGAEQRRFLTVNVSRGYDGIIFLRNQTLTGSVQMRVQ